MAKYPDFKVWYSAWQKRLAEDRLAKFFLDCRNITQKIGESPICCGYCGDGISYCSFLPSKEFPNVPSEEVAVSCRQYMTLMTELVKDFHSQFKHVVDPWYYFTQENFSRLGLTVEDAEMEIIGVRGWTSGIPETERWRLLREEVGKTGIETLFLKYLELKSGD